MKCGDNLKHINGRLDGQQLYSNLEQLRSKIRECFKITSDKDFDLSYVDVDGDTVMLADDSDLFDATIKQGLSPVQINVELIPNKTKIKPGRKHGVQQIEINTGYNAETNSPLSGWVQVSDVGSSGKSPK